MTTPEVSIGIDVGGTKIAGGLVDGDGRVLADAKIDSPADDAASLTKAIGDLAAELAARHDGDVAGVGVAVAGFIDRDRSTVMFAANLAFRDEPLRDSLTSRLDLPVVVENDANAAAWGEFRFGAARDHQDMLLITVGTGIGGGVVVDGHLMRGGFGVAGEVGHLEFEPGGRVCGCGNRGCWEPYGSGSALVADTRALADSPEAAALVEFAGGTIDDIEGPEITTAAKNGDDFARARLRDLGGHLGRGIATLAAVLDPSVVALGGGVSAAGDLLLDPVRESFRAHVTGRDHRPLPRIKAASLGNEAGLIGAAALVHEPLPN